MSFSDGFNAGSSMFKPPKEIGSWNEIMDNLGISADEFYEVVMEILRHNEFQKSKMKLIWKKESLFSAYRKGLRIEFKSYYFDVLCIHQIHNHYIGWKLFKSSSSGLDLLSSIPIAKDIVRTLEESNGGGELHLDTAYKAMVHKSIIAAIEVVRNQKISRGNKRI